MSRDACREMMCSFQCKCWAHLRARDTLELILKERIVIIRKDVHRDLNTVTEFIYLAKMLESLDTCIALPLFLVELHRLE